MSRDEIYIMIGKQLSGELSEMEEQQFQKWLGDSPNNQNTYEVMKKSWEVESEVQIKAQQGRLFDKIVEEIGEDEFSKYEQAKVIPLRRLMSYAAAVVFLVISTMAIWSITQPTGISENVAMVTKSNPKGQKSTIHLPDGSKVVLNAGSSLSYPSAFAGNFREIILDGEAFFDVMKNPEQPFIVRSKNISVRALGTAFNVNAMRESIEVALTEGRVQVTRDNDTETALILNPGEMASIDPAQNELIKSQFDINRVTAWTDGRLVFQDASMQEVLDKLENWYGVDIETKNFHSLSWNYNGEFNNEHLSRVLMSLGFAQGFDYEIDGKRVVLTGRE